MKRNERTYTDLPPEDLLAEGSEPALLVRSAQVEGTFRIPLYAGEDLPHALARARKSVPDATEIELQVYHGGRFHYARLP